MQNQVENCQELNNLLSESIETLKQITQANVKNNEESVENAKKVFNDLKNKFSLFDLHLVWEYSLLGNHYQILIIKEEETITISLANNQYIPWGLRNAIHPRQYDFVIVDGYTLSVEDVMKIIDEHLNNVSIRESIVKAALINSKLEKMDDAEKSIYNPTETELQQFFNSWRVKRGLEKISDYNEYLSLNGYSHNNIEEGLRAKKAHLNFLNSIPSKDPKQYFSENTSDFVRYEIESYIVKSDEDSIKLKDFLEKNPNDLCLWAREKFLSSNNIVIESSSYNLAKCFHFQLDKEVADLIHQSPKLGLLPPIRMNEKWTFVNVLSITPAQYDDEIESVIRQRLLAEWSRKTQQECSIQWLWGDKDIFPNRNIQEA